MRGSTCSLSLPPTMSTNRNASTRLPRAFNDDIWDLIALELENDRAALCTAALASSILRKPMQRVLFRTVFDTHLAYFASSLLANPALGSYVRWFYVCSASELNLFVVYLDRSGTPVALAGTYALRLGPTQWRFHHLPLLAAQFSSLNVLELVNVVFHHARELKSMLDCFPHLNTLRWHRSRIERASIEPGALVLPQLRNFHWDEVMTESTEKGYAQMIHAWAHAGAWETLDAFAVNAEAAPLFWPALIVANPTLRHLCVLNIMHADAFTAALRQGMFSVTSVSLQYTHTGSAGRSNTTLLVRLETLVLAFCTPWRRREFWNTTDYVRAAERLLEAIESPQLRALTFVVYKPKIGVLASASDWTPLVDAVQKFLCGCSPHTRKTVRVIIIASLLDGHQGRMSASEEALCRLRDIADVDVSCVSLCKYASDVAGPVPHFPLATHHGAQYD
jgi:hypothetical protein